MNCSVGKAQARTCCVDKLVAQRLGANPAIKATALKKNLEQKMGVVTTLRNVTRARTGALMASVEEVEASYQSLPWYFNYIVKESPGSVAVVEVMRLQLPK